MPPFIEVFNRYKDIGKSHYEYGKYRSTEPGIWNFRDWHFRKYIKYIDPELYDISGIWMAHNFTTALPIFKKSIF